MRTIMLIGGLSSGKSTVVGMLRKRGASCLDLDEVGRDVLDLPVVVDLLKDSFGDQILCDGKISRPELAKVSFSSKESLDRLNSITHPFIISAALEKLRSFRDAGCELAVIEVSAFNGPSDSVKGLLAWCDALVAVIAPEEQRLARAAGKGMSEEDAQKRIDQQPSDSMRRQWADYVINNHDGQNDLEEQISFILHDLAR